MTQLTSESKTKNVEIEYVTANDSTTSSTYSDATCGTISIPDKTMAAIACRVSKSTAGTGSLRLTDNATGTQTYLELTTSGSGAFTLSGVFINNTGSTITAKLQLKSSDANTFQILQTTNARGAIMAADYILFTPDTTEHELNMKIFSSEIDFVGFMPTDDDNRVLFNGFLQQQDGVNESETVKTIPTNNIITKITYQALDTAGGIIGFGWTGINLNVTV